MTRMTRRSRRTIAALLLSSSACLGTGSDGGEEEPGPEPALECDSYDTLQLGRCERASDGNDCTGDADETMVYQPLTDGDPVHLVVGPQAANMLVFLAETSDIHPGDPDDPVSKDNPLVEAELVEADERVSEVQLRSSFSQDPDGTMLRSNSGLFLVIEAEDYEVIGKSYEVTARVTDKDDQLRCGRVLVTVALDPEPQLPDE